MKKRALLIVFLSLITSPLIAAAQNDGERLFETRCGSACHQLPEPAMLTANQWQRVLITMQKRMEQADMPPLTKEEKEQLMTYLTQHAKK